MPDEMAIPAAERPSFGEWLAEKAQQPREVTVKRYRCPHCRYSRSSRKPVVEHIARCWHNPVNRACKTCIHFERATGHTDDTCLAGVDLLKALGYERNRCMSDCSLWTGPAE